MAPVEAELQSFTDPAPSPRAGGCHKSRPIQAAGDLALGPCELESLLLTAENGACSPLQNRGVSGNGMKRSIDLPPSL